MMYVNRIINFFYFKFHASNSKRLINLLLVSTQNFFIQQKTRSIQHYIVLTSSRISNGVCGNAVKISNALVIPLTLQTCIGYRNLLLLAWSYALLQS